MRRLAAATILATLSVAAPASAHLRIRQVADHPAAPSSALAVQVENEAGVSSAVLQRIERGLLIQVNQQVRPWWHTPTVRFGASAWRLRIVRPSVMRGLQGDVGGFHANDDAGPFAVVSSAGGEDGLSSSMSHELIEMLVNPQGERTINRYLAEVCDPVERATYFVWDGETPTFVADFVTPLWFGGAGQGRTDQDQATTHPGDLRLGSIDRLDPSTSEFVTLGNLG